MTHEEWRKCHLPRLFPELFMQNNKPVSVDVTIVLDRSGSMSLVATDTIGGFNRFLEDQQKQEGECTFALNQFNDEFENVCPPTSVKSIQPLTKETFVPRGFTALLDAIGRTINQTGIRLHETKSKPGKVIIVIITDGHENASREFRNSQISDMIAHQRDKYAWEFVYIGADQDAIATASQYGFQTGNTIGTMSTLDSSNAMYSGLSANVRAVRSGAKADMSWTSAQKKTQKDMGASEK